MWKACKFGLFFTENIFLMFHLLFTFCLDGNISYIGVIRGTSVQNLTPVLKIYTPWGQDKIRMNLSTLVLNSVHQWLHRDNEFISYFAFVYFVIYGYKIEKQIVRPTSITQFLTPTFAGHFSNMIFIILCVENLKNWLFWGILVLTFFLKQSIYKFIYFSI